MKYLESLVGSKIRHNNGGNCREVIHLIEHKGRLYVYWTDTRELSPGDNKVILEDGDRLTLASTERICRYAKNDDMLLEVTLLDWIKLKEKKLAEGWET